MQSFHGLVAVLDALGAADFTEAGVDAFLRSHSLVLGLLQTRSDTRRIGSIIQRTRLHVFTFNDTVLIAYRAKSDRITRLELEMFCRLLRAFQVDSLTPGIRFRGSMSIGPFYRMSEKANVIMGPAVSDAARDYEVANWIGIHLTSDASLAAAGLVGADPEFEYVLVDYDVPMKVGASRRLKAINWPRGFYVRGLCPPGTNSPRARFLECLGSERAPAGTEQKYANTIAFFEHLRASQQFGKWS